MGRVNQNSSASAPLIKHFSHPHELVPIPHNPQNLILCSGCKLEASGIMYTCTPCNFSLHTACTQFPKLITHPSHPGCNLTLLPVSTYHGGKFNCDACNRHGEGFSYHCVKCDYDLHVVCAKNPLKITHRAHSCPLQLTFKNPYEAKGFSCDICRQIGVKQWLYRCNSCEFDVHLDCTMAMPKHSVKEQKFMLHHHHSYPSASHQNHHVAAGFPLNPNHNLMHSASTGSQFQAPGQANNLMHSASIGGIANPHMGPVNTGSVPTNMVPMHNNIQPRPNKDNGLGATMMTAAMQGLVEGAFQQVGQNVMQGIIGGGDSGENGGTDGGADGYSEY
ncbi:Cysteine/Histidine-rich C1 domain family protein [Forsythia ovata]|uniref:Cysteine/Histidine-rich C1 domain family protein n=1 Tax=Forsythia ovata TaxID=205694 RepID=A0ABD1TRI0_9LAMI